MPLILRWLLRLGPTNPIAVRLVQNGSRRIKHLYIRSAYLAILILVLLWYLMTIGSGDMSYRDLAAAGAESFQFVAYLQIALICLLAPVFMAGAIAQEANPKTWDIMLTTPLSALQIVLGNLFGRLFFILALLVASLPLFALTQYFGGVPGQSIFTSYLIAACAALLVGTIAIALSVSRLVGKRAVFAFYVSVVSYLALTWALDVWIRSSGRGAAGGGGVTHMTAINPFLSLRALLSPSTYGRAAPGTLTGLDVWFLERPVMLWCLGSLVISVVLIGLSTFTVRTGGIAGLSAGGVPLYRRLFGLGGRDADHRPPRAVWTNPVAWREAAARNSTMGKILARWSFIAAGAIFGLLIIWFYHVGSLDHDEFRLALQATVWGELGVATLVVMYMAATAVSREREDGTLDLLLTTPITPKLYLSGKMRGLIAYALPMLAVPLGTLAVAAVYVLAGGLGRADGVEVSQSFGTTTASAPVVLPEAALLAPLVVIPFIAFAVMVGLQWSLKSKGTIASVVATVGIVGVVSGIIGLCGWRSGSDVPMLGPVMSALSPASAIYAMIDPLQAMFETVDQSELGGARVALALGAGVSAAIYLVIVYGILTNMTRTFDMTVRKLAGTR